MLDDPVARTSRTLATATGQITVTGGGNSSDDATDDDEARLEECTVPNVVGLTVPKAKRRLADAGCRLGTVMSVRSAKKKGTILTQALKAGRTETSGAKLAVVVSRGPKSRN